MALRSPSPGAEPARTRQASSHRPRGDGRQRIHCNAPLGRRGTRQLFPVGADDGEQPGHLPRPDAALDWELLQIILQGPSHLETSSPGKKGGGVTTSIGWGFNVGETTVW